jgi:hypothetical protein
VGVLPRKLGVVLIGEAGVVGRQSGRAMDRVMT